MAKESGSKRGHGNPSNNAAKRELNTASQWKASGSKENMGLAQGVRVPMEMFNQKYEKPDLHSASRTIKAGTVAASAKSALRGHTKKFFGLGGTI